jgi:hypothetical protein
MVQQQFIGEDGVLYTVSRGAAGGAASTIRTDATAQNGDATLVATNYGGGGSSTRMIMNVVVELNAMAIQLEDLLSSGRSYHRILKEMDLTGLLVRAREEIVRLNGLRMIAAGQRDALQAEVKRLQDRLDGGHHGE